MRLLHRDIDRDGVGTITLLPEELEDMWHAYNLIAVGDHVRATTLRKVQQSSSTGSVKNERVRLTLTIAVENIDFEAEAGVLRLKGTNVSESQHVKMGAYHTIDLEMNRKFTLQKTEWDAIALERVETATNPARTADVAAVIMAEGLAQVCLITSSMTIVRQRVESTIPRKRKGSASLHDKALNKFYENVMQGILRHVNFEIIKCVIIASPGFVREQFFEYMNAEAIRRDIKLLIEHKSKFVLVHSSSGHKHSLKEVLSDPNVAPRLAETKAAGEVKALDEFFEMMRNDSDRAFYGYNDIVIADSRMAVQSLLLTDELFRASNIATRKKYVQLVESVREHGGDVKICSALHVSGEQLKQLGGVAAVLRFPLPDVGGDEESEEEEEGADKDGQSSSSEAEPKP
ncbi:translation factor pelota, putative [Acanthamoeba castellanii str. Neff]|uniref:Protein pelota homolog n=1 Tax=Acanthamoeba castellanii (strain ATCC 30010 / Neff) TaxID=1257118 RepID=L8GL32_ACACF|nr:translation factor pelota, putative [Acanthamoeba castellanii str. Neff]ELR12906.1 translation factor pelota, putative [Acanthamoeba castellanii str. Neff]